MYNFVFCQEFLLVKCWDTYLQGWAKAVPQYLLVTRLTDYFEDLLPLLWRVGWRHNVHQQPPELRPEGVLTRPHDLGPLLLGTTAFTWTLKPKREGSGIRLLSNKMLIAAQNWRSRDMFHSRLFKTVQVRKTDTSIRMMSKRDGHTSMYIVQNSQSVETAQTCPDGRVIKCGLQTERGIIQPHKRTKDWGMLQHGWT